MTRKIQIRQILWVYILAFVLMAFSFHAEAKKVSTKESTDKKSNVVVMKTSLGTIEITLDPVKAPISTENFLKYVDDKFYDGVIFHRVIDGFMIQGGGFTSDMKEKSTRASIKNEAKNGLLNKKGSIAMARTSVVDSASAQFFINLVDNERLDHKPDYKSDAEYGYAVFGEVTKGMDVVEKIKGVATTTKGEYENVPVTAVVIKSAKRK